MKGNTAVASNLQMQLPVFSRSLNLQPGIAEIWQYFSSFSSVYYMAYFLHIQEHVNGYVHIYSQTQTNLILLSFSH